MTYIIEQAGQFLRRAEAGNIAWGPRHFQPASTLTSDERAMFGVHELVETPRPTFDPEAQKVVELDPAPVNGVWTQQWKVVELTADEIAARAVARLRSFAPPQIIAALEAMGVAGVILANTDDLTKAKFYTASSVREDDERLLAALGAVGKTIDELKAAVV